MFFFLGNSDVLKGERYNYACTFFDRVQGENPM
jgi:hypothetical protein